MEIRPENTLLIVDDEAAIRDSFRFFLEDFDFRVLEACNGREALQVFQSEKVDLILADLRMPEMDGLEMLKIPLS